MRRDRRLEVGVRLASRCYRRLLSLGPAGRRPARNRQIVETFEDLCRAAARERGLPGLLRQITAGVSDLVRTAVTERHRATPGPHSRLPVARNAMDRFVADCRHSVRDLARSPGFTAVAVTTLALGIGASTLIISVADAVLFRPLPYPEPARLVMVGTGSGGSGSLSPMSPADFLELRARNRSFSAVAASASATLDLVGEGPPRRFPGARVSAGFFRVLGVEPAVGRTFRATEERPGSDRVAVVSHAAWQAQWGGDPSLVGRSITLNRASHTVVGVMPAGFRPPEGIPYQPEVQVWVPLVFDRDPPGRSSSYLWTIARLDDSVTLARAAEEIDALTSVFRREFYAAEDEFTLRVERLYERTVGGIRSSLLVLLGAVGLLLLIACANAANLSLGRGLDRGHEIATRVALGAGQGRIVQQLLVDSLVIAGAGGVLGTFLAYGGVYVLPLVDPGRLPRAAEVTVDGRVLLFALGLSLLTGVAFGLGPALRMARIDPGAMLTSEPSRHASRRRHATGAALLAAQIGLALMLLIGAGLLINGFVRRNGVDPGFEPRNLLMMRLYIPPENPAGSRWAPSSEAEWEGWRSFYSELLERVEAIPGVSAAAGTTSPPIVGASIWRAVTAEGRPPDASDSGYLADNRVSPGYFATLGTPVLRGREFTRADDQGASHAIVSRAFAERYWPGEDPLGKRLQYGSAPDPDGHFMTVVGVVEDTTQAALGSEPQPELFVPFFQDPLRAMTVLARHDGDPGVIADAMREAVWNLAPELPVTGVEQMETVAAASIVQERFYTLLLATFASIALFLAAVGIHGTMARSVRRRAREVGVRLALGARRSDVVRLIVGQAMKVTAMGMLVGVAGAMALARFLEGFVYGVEPTDPATIAVVAGILWLVALSACCVPARRAARLDPATTLGAE